MIQACSILIKTGKYLGEAVSWANVMARVTREQSSWLYLRVNCHFTTNGKIGLSRDREKQRDGYP